ncbi:phospho-sugar mutase [Helicobacter sp. CLO-3]|uniref:phosphomannomutase/phosphoglucomutase n=1 Tax=unclassified Helicobacter TaxID=2593540 RepID=UPI000805E302|nr:MULTISPECIES: phosphomannomutase/phosphoglucomutase [unclassified Helicobacter]OBV29669.1 phospho-sugar mutase [Helicobacter sp. CLO-3]OHU82413.1 phospho-sugar mutase [Helicobacter sp. CLO-3]
MQNLDMSIFREYDIRGIYEENLTRQNVFGIGFLLGKYIADTTPESTTIAIGYDARVHSPVLFEWLKDGLLASGCEVVFMGMIPTPVAYFATFQEDVPSGLKSSIRHSVMITGSHNPPQYNGFKITIDRKPFYGDMIRALGERLQSTDIAYQASQKEVQKIDMLARYQDYLIKHFARLKDFKYEVVFDYGNGVGAIGLESVLDALNIKHVSLYEKPDGTFPNHHPDPSEAKNLESVKSYMKAHDLQIAIAFDGDADRVALMTPRHDYKGDELAILFARDIAKTTPNPIVIGEVKCSQVMYDEIDKIGKSVMYKTGHSNLKTKLKELGAHLAAEMSGHLFFNDRYYGYDDALYAALRALELFVGRTPSEVEGEILALPQYFSTLEEKIHTTEEVKFKTIERLKSRLESIKAESNANFPAIKDIIDIDGVRVIFDEGWGLVRASNTTPVLVTRFEARSKEKLESYKNSILKLLKEIG